MLIDAREFDPDSVLECDLCVVGGGAVGIALAYELRNSGLEVLILESGGLSYAPPVQDLYLGSESGNLLDGRSDYLGSTRLRYFGGTTNHWNGWTRPLDALDFAGRSWIPDSRWPLTREELEPYYVRAAALAEVAPFDYQPEALRGKYPFLLQSGFESSFMHISPPTRFGTAYRKPLVEARSVRVLLNATLIEIEAGESREHVETLTVACGDGRRLTVRPRAAVLATGAIENARLLLANDLGNHHDLVGRYFMDHPHKRVGYTVLPDCRWICSRYLGVRRDLQVQQRVRAVLRPTDELQREHRVSSAILVLKPVHKSDRPALLAQVAGLAQAIASLGRAKAPAVRDEVLAAISMTLEPVPNPSSRVRLDEELDPLGVPRTRLDWNLSADDGRSTFIITRQLSRRLALERGGRTELNVSEDNPLGQASGSPHQLGTTRMASSASGGVVDPQGLVHGMDNLYVAGGSVFPTAGCSNPTLTILALAVRLGDHLGERLAG